MALRSIAGAKLLDEACVYLHLWGSSPSSGSSSEVEPQIIVAHFLCAAPEDKNRKEVLMRVQIYVAAKRLAGAPRKLCLAVVTSQCMAPNQQPEPGPFTASPTS
jgi:hypothetical protein